LDASDGWVSLVFMPNQPLARVEYAWVAIELIAIHAWLIGLTSTIQVEAHQPDGNQLFNFIKS
jgi:hypothetical protein